MGTTSSIFIGMLSLAAAAFGFAWTKNYFVSILIAVVAMLVGKSVVPFVLILWDRFRNRFFPLPEITPFFESNLQETEDQDVPAHTQGIRVLAMTEALNLNSKTKSLYQEMVAQSLEALSKEHPIFQRRLEVVNRREKPMQYVAALCGKDGEKMRKCLSTWLKTYAVRDMKARTQNRDLFLHDGEIRVPKTGEDIRYTVMVLFDGSLPVTIPKTSEEAKSPAEDTNT